MKEEISKQNQELITGFMDKLSDDQKAELLLSQYKERQNTKKNKARNKRKQQRKIVFRFDNSRRPHGTAKRLKKGRDKVDYQRYFIFNNGVIDMKPKHQPCIRRYSDQAAAVRFCNRANSIHSERFIRY